MAVVDNNVLSSLAKIERLDLLDSFFEKVLTTPEILHELKSEEIAGYEFPSRIFSKQTYENKSEDKWILATDIESQEKKERDSLTEKGLSLADSECLSVASNRDEVLLTDDTHLGEMAKEMGVRVFDLETFLEACAMRGLISSPDEAEEILSKLEEKDFYNFSEGFKRDLMSIFE